MMVTFPDKKVPYFLVGLLFLVLILSPFFIKVKVECQSQFGACPSEVVDQLNTLNNRSLFQVRRLAGSYLKKSFLVSDFSMQFKLPNILLAQLLIKKPEFAVLDKSSGNIGLVDADGKIISLTKNSGLPTVAVASEELKLGGSVSSTEIFDLKLIRGVWEMYQISLGEVQNESLIVELPGPVTVIFPESGDSDVMLGALRLIYGKVESAELAGKYSQIDLRFKNPVLR